MLERAHQGIVGVPRLSRRHLSRPRLLELLSTDMPLTVLRGPAGSGKTALLSEWAKGVRADGVWVSMADDVDSRLAFWRTVITALTDADLLDANSPLREPLGITSVRRALVRGLRRLPDQHLLVIDNTGPLLDADVDEDILTVVREVEHINIVLAGRGRTTLEHPRAAVQTDLRLIGPADLAFTPDEIDELVRYKTGRNSVDGGRMVREVTGGHPILVRAALQHANAGTGELLERVGLQAFITTVVRAELRHALDDPRQRQLATFLMRCSLPEHLNPGLIDQLGSGMQVERHLEQLEMLGVLEIDPTSGVTRVLPAVRDLLRTEAGTRLRRQLPQLHTQIANWELAEGNALAALRHATAAGDLALITTVISQEWEHFLWGGVMTEVEEILQRVPREELHGQPLIAAVIGLAVNMDASRRSRAIRYLTVATEGARSLRRAAAPSQHFFFGVLESSLARIAGEPHGLRARAEAGARTLTEQTGTVTSSRSEPIFRSQLAITLFRTGRGDQALHLLRDAVTAPADGPGLAPHQALTIKAGIHAHLGTMRNSRELMAVADDLTWPPGMRDSYLGVLGHYAAVWDRLEAFDLAGAEQHLDVITPQHVNIEFQPYIELMRANLGLLQGRANGALVRLTEAMQRMQVDQRMLGPEQATLVKFSALLSLAAGRTGEARAALQVDGGALNSVVRAAIELAAGHPQEALVQLAARQREPTSPRSAAPHHLVLAAASLRAGDRIGALDAAERLAALMNYHGLRSHLVYVPRSDLLAVRDFLVEERPDLKDTFGDLGTVPNVLPSTGNVALLTRREKAVLVELSRLVSTREIATALGVSTNTVKSQLRSIYRKLGASSREEALSVAMREGMLKLP